MTTLDELIDYCNEPKPVGAMLLTGEWGCGKTYLIENSLRDELIDKAILVRISLFGITTINEIHDTVKSQFFDYWCEEKKIKKATEKLKMAQSFIEKLAFVPENIRGIVSTDASSFLPLATKIDEKKVVLVFDDLERCSLNIVDILGLINEYCENKEFHTIVIANQEKIYEKHSYNTPPTSNKKLENSKSAQDTESRVIIDKSYNTISYNEIKEKIIHRTIIYTPDYNSIIHAVINDMEYRDDDYRKFIIRNESSLLELFTSNVAKIQTPNNIRSFKCAISDFYRIYKILNDRGIDNLEMWLTSFTAYIMTIKANLISINSSNSLSSDDYQIVKEHYPSFESKYILESIKNWAMKGLWNTHHINQEIDRIIERNKAVKPCDIIKSYRLPDIDNSVLEKGFDEFLLLLYKGDLSLDEYIQFICNCYWARKDQFKLPEVIDWKKVRAGIRKQIDSVKKDLPKGQVTHNMIGNEQRDQFTDDEWEAYMLISTFSKRDQIIFLENKKLYIDNIRNSKLDGFYKVKNKMYHTFDNDMAKVTADAFIQNGNLGKNYFIGSYYDMWASYLSNPSSFDSDTAIIGFQTLYDSINENLKTLQEGKKRTYEVIHTEKFLNKIDELIKLANSRNTQT